jgi:hypothetical protein
MQRAFGMARIPSKDPAKATVPRLRLGRHYFAAVSALFSRALRRFAAFSWMIPRLAALSIAEISARICSGLGVCAERTVFCIVRRPVTTLRLRSDRFTVWRARLAADFVLAIVKQKSCGRARSPARRDCQLRRFSRPGFTCRRGSDASVQGLSATNACSIRASPFVAEQQAPHPPAFDRLRAYRSKLEQKKSGSGSEFLRSRLRKC